MVLEEFWSWLEATPLAAHIGESAWFPFLESVHVLSAMFVVGTVLMADLRLLGWTARRYPVTVITSEVVPWTWGAFVIAAVTGVGLLLPRASWLLLAGVNMLALHFFALRTERVRLQMTTAACSLIVWAGVVLAGRWIGHLS
jgi:hypothetical protein